MLKCDKIKLSIEIEQILGCRAIYVSAQHGPYEESHGDPSGDSSSNLRQKGIVQFYVSNRDNDASCR